MQLSLLLCKLVSQVVREALADPTRACFIIEEAVEQYYGSGGVSEPKYSRMEEVKFEVV